MSHNPIDALLNTLHCFSTFHLLHRLVPFKDVVEKDGVGQIDIRKKKCSTSVFHLACLSGTWHLPHDGISVEAGVFHVATNHVNASCKRSQLRSSGYPLQVCYELSTELGYHITKPSANEAHGNKYINPRNAIRSNVLNFAREVFCKCSRDIVTNCRAHLTKTKNFDSQSKQIHDHVGSIQHSLAL